jgi:hypothetical protein
MSGSIWEKAPNMAPTYMIASSRVSRLDTYEYVYSGILNFAKKLTIKAVENPDSNCGLYAPGTLGSCFFLSIASFSNHGTFVLDPDAYDVFAELFHPVIGDYHKVDVATLKSVHDLGKAENLEDLSERYADQIVSTRVRVGRTVKGFPMASKLSREVILFNSN